jgi:PAS domain S-box-containing protein
MVDFMAYDAANEEYNGPPVDAAAFCVADGQGRLLDVGEGLCLLSGYPRAELLSLSLAELEAGGSGTWHTALINTATSGSPARAEIGLRQREGGVRQVEVEAAFLPALGQVILTFRDSAIFSRVLAELRQKSEECDTYFRKSLDLLCVADNSGYFRRLNPAWEEVLGFPLHELLGRKFIDLVHPDDREATMGAMSDLAHQRQVKDFTNRYRVRDGSYRWLEWRAAPAGDLVFAVARDVTDRILAQERLCRSEERYRLLFEEMMSGCALHELICDRDGNPADYRFLAVNGAFERMTGLRAADIVGKTVLEVMPGTERHWIERYGDVALSGRSAEFEEYAGAIGRYYSVRAYCPERGKFAAVFNDITERRLMEDELRRQEQSHRLVLDNIPDIIARFDRELRHLYVSAAITRVTGFPPEHFIGRTNREIGMPDELVDRWDAAINEVFSSGREQRLEFTYQSPRGLRHFETTLIPERGADDSSAAVLVVNHDITELKNAELGMRQLNEELERRVGERTRELELSNRELDSFCSAVSHDLRAPLRHIAGFSRVVAEDYGDRLDHGGRDLLTRIEGGAQRMDTLINELLSLSRTNRSPLECHPVNLSTIAMDVVTDLREAAPDRLVDTEIAPDVMAQCDGNLIRVVLSNLLGNAWKFTSRTERARIEFGVIPSGDQQTFFVRDNGAGFDMNFADKLFVPFQRLHARDDYEGTGIGLATVQRIIHRHGGKIWADAAADRGATFWFTLGDCLGGRPVSP